MIHKSEFLMFLPLKIPVNLHGKMWFKLILERFVHMQRHSYIKDSKCCCLLANCRTAKM